MKKNFGFILTALILLAITLFFVFLLQGREEQLSREEISAVSTDTDKSDQEENAAKFEEVSIGDIVSVEERVLSPSFAVSLQYDKYSLTYTYFLVEKEAVNIRSGPSRSEKIIRKAFKGEKLNYLESVFIKSGENSTDCWYHVTWDVEEEPYFGFVESTVVTKRLFQFDKMEEAVLTAQEYADRGKLTYINNYQNKRGYAPLYNGGTVDGAGNGRSQSAPGYSSPANKGDFIYIGDGTLVRYLFTNGDFIKVEVIATGDRYYVPRKYIPADGGISELNKVIAIDRKNQNEAVYEKVRGSWTMISYTLATTGTTGKYAQPTPLGYYFGIEKRGQFFYYEDGTTRIQGYAPYAIRFAGGAYVHGVPVNYKYSDTGARITPPIQEYSKTIGTVPLSHKCVRNYTSHAKFLYDWYAAGETIVIVIE